MSKLAFFTAFFLALPAAQAMARDLTLDEAEALLVRNNRELQAVRRAIESADAQTLIAGARPNPTVSINTAGQTLSPDIAGPGPFRDQYFDTLLRVDQPFERGNKRELRLDVASSMQRAARNTALDVLRQQLAVLQAAYFDTKLAQEKTQVLAESAALFGGTLAAAQRRLKAGDLAPADVAKVQVDYERAQNDALAARAELARAQLAFAYLIGAEGEALELRAVDPWPALARADPAAVEQAIDTRPDVVAAKDRLQAAESLRDLARAQRTRDISLGAQAYRFPGSPFNPPGAQGPVYSLGFGISFPLFTGYDFSGDIQKAGVERYAAMDALARARAAAMNELRRAAGDLNAAAERIERYDASLLAAANQSAQATEFAFSRGAVSVLEVLDARRTLRSVRLEALAARNDHVKALAAWRAAQASVQTLEGK